jgi:hypothetical protein
MYGWKYGFHLSAVLDPGYGTTESVPGQLPGGYSGGIMSFAYGDFGFYWGIIGDGIPVAACVVCGGAWDWDRQRDTPTVNAKHIHQATAAEINAVCTVEALNANGVQGIPSPYVIGPSYDSASASGAIYQEWKLGANQSPYFANPEGVAGAEVAEGAMASPDLLVAAAKGTCIRNLTPP